jgi:predicted RND superfamily exporter protein
MTGGLQRRIFVTLPTFISSHRRTMAVVLAAATVVMAAGIPRMHIDMSTESFFLEHDPVKVTYRAFREHFGSDEFIYIVYRAMDGDLFSARSLAALERFHRALSDAVENSRTTPHHPLSHVTDITSLFNVSNLEADRDTLRSRDFIAASPRKTAADREALRAQAMSHPSYIPSLLNRRGDFSVIILDTDLGAARTVDAGAPDIDFFLDGDSQADTAAPAAEFVRPTLWDYKQLVDAVQERIDASAARDALQFYPVGNPVIMTFFANVFTTEVNIITLGAVGLIVLTFYLLFRSLRAVLSAMIIVTTALLWTLGICGWMGVTMTLMVTVIIFLTLSVGVADAVHLLSGYVYMRQEGMDHAPAVSMVFRTSGPACFLTSITTMIGLLALLVVPIVPLKVFGIFSGLGVFLAFAFTMVILPMTITPTMIRPAAGTVPRRHTVQRMLRRVEPLVTARPLMVSLLFLVASGVFGYGVTLIRVDTNMGKLISPRNPIRQNIDTVEANLGGTMDMEILLSTGADDALKDPRVLDTMAALQDYLERAFPDLVVSTYSLADAVKESFKALNEDRPEMYRIPDTRPMVAQTLLLFESAAPEDQAKLATGDYANARISVRVRNRGSFEYMPFMAAVRQRIDTLTAPLKNDYPQLRGSITGVFALTMRLAQFVSWSQIKSFSLALAVISVLFIFVFRSLKGGLISIIPNLFPILAAFGAMGFLGYSLDLDTLLVAPIAIGLAVDDTIHFLTRYRMEQLAGHDPPAAVIRTFREVGQAMIFTTVILSTGFFLFFFCQHTGLSHFGILSATAISTAVVADLFFLPRLCILTDLRFGPDKRRRIEENAVD